MGERIERLKRFAKAVGHNLTKIGEQGSKVLESLEKSDREMDAKLKEILKTASV